jgi:stringent starvation protein B
MPTQPLPPKKEVALALLERSSVFVHLDPRLQAVVVPPGFKKQPQLVLQVGLNMPVPIRDLHLDDEGMTCTLSFNRTPFFCVIPWVSVYAIVGCDDGRGMIWPEDVPPEVAQAQARAATEESAMAKAELVKPAVSSERNGEAPKPKRARKRPSLGAVPDANGEEAVVAAKAARPSPPPVQRPRPSPQPLRSSTAETGRKRRELPPYLRVVK